MYYLPESVEAPLKEGDVIGTLLLSYANQPLTTIQLVASESVDRSELLFALHAIRQVVSSQWFIIAVIVVAVLALVYAVILLIYRRKKRTQRPVKKYRKF